MNLSPSAKPRSWMERLWWLWVGLGCGAVALLFAAQAVWIGGIPWEGALSWTALDWAPWVVLAPGVVVLSRRLQVTATTWRWAVPAHVVLAILFATAVEIVAQTVLRQRWLPAGRAEPRAYFGDGPPRGPEPAMRRPAGPLNSRDADAGGRPGVREFRPRPPPDSDSRPSPGRAPDTEPRGPRPPAPKGSLARWPLSTPRGRLALPIYFVIVAAAHAFANHRRSLDRERRALLAEARLAEARALTLQNQLQPHFFFNALNTVASLIYTRPEQAEETICTLGELMRGVLDAAHRPAIPLHEELAFIQRYLAVQQVRFGDRLQVTREIDEATLTCAVPTLLLQPLVENAVVHGIAPSPAPGRITLRARRAGERLVLEVVNTCGPDAAPSPAGPVEFSPRVGLGNTRARLEALYGGDFRLGHCRSEDGSLLTLVELPWRRNNP